MTDVQTIHFVCPSSSSAFIVSMVHHPLSCLHQQVASSAVIATPREPRTYVQNAWNTPCSKVELTVALEESL